MDLEATFDAYHAPLYRYLVRLSGDAELAADAAQEAFVRLAERPPANQHNLRAWLYTVAGNYVRDAFKLARRRLELLRESPERAPLGDGPLGPDRYAEEGERRRMLREAMDGLNHKERSTLLMRSEGFSYRDIAGALDVSPNSVGVIASRALRKLAMVLEADKAGLT